MPAPNAIKDIDDRADISKNTKRLKISLVKIIPFKLPIAKSQRELSFPCIVRMNFRKKNFP